MSQATTEVVVLAPQPGPQEGFLASSADIAIMGGAAGGGKTYAVLLWLARCSTISGFAAVVFRRVAPDLTGGGSIWEESQELFRAMGGQPRQSPNLDWRFPSGSLVEFRHLQHKSDVYSHQGKQYACVVFEEVTQFEEDQFWYLISRMRTKSKVRAHMRATCNPDPDSFVRALIDWWIGPDGFPIRERSGVLRWFVRAPTGELAWYDTKEAASADFPASKPLSLTFIPAGLDDNPKGDPTYRERLEALPLVERARLLGGNWNIRKTAGNILRREWFTVVDSPPSPVLRSVRGWDKGATVDGDATEGAKLGDMGAGKGWIIQDIKSVRGTPATVFAAMKASAQQDGLAVPVAIWQDPGQAGIVDVDTTRAELSGYRVAAERASQSKVAYAEPWAAVAERGSKGEGPRIYVQRAPWNEAFFAEVDAFDGRDGGTDNKIDAVSRAWLELHRVPVGTGSSFVPRNPTVRGGFH